MLLYLPFKKGALLFACVWLCAAVSFAQNITPVIDVSRILLSDTIHSRVLEYKDSLHEANAGNIQTKPFAVHPWRFLRRPNIEQTSATWWITFRVTNTGNSTVRAYVFLGYYPRLFRLYKRDRATLQLIPAPAAIGPVEDSAGLRRIIVNPGDTNTYYGQFELAHTNANSVDFRLLRDYYVPAFSRGAKFPLNNSTMFAFIITGILLMMIIYSMAVFVLNRNHEFLIYACYALFTGLLFFLKSYFNRSFSSFNVFFETYLDFIIQSLGVFFYYIFLRRFLDTKKTFPFLHKLFIVGQWLTLASMLVFTWFSLGADNFKMQEAVESLTKYAWLLTTVIFIVYAVRLNIRLLNFLVVGHFLLLLFSVASVLMIGNPGLFSSTIYSIWRDSMFYYELGMTLELILFLTALAFKNRDDIVERTRERERLLLENERKEFEKQLAVVEAKQEERNRISADMHDELGSGVTAIRLMSEIVKTKMRDSTLPEIDKISNNANELLTKLNTIIWTMSSSNDRLDNMIAYTRAYALEYFESTGIDCHFELPEYIPPTEMSGEKRRNVFLCVKESLNNIVKHAKAGDVWIRVNIDNNTLHIQLHDNGCGINLQKLREFGNGLNNMKKRMDSIGGQFSIANENGTVTNFVVPL